MTDDGQETKSHPRETVLPVVAKNLNKVSFFCLMPLKQLVIVIITKL